MPAALPGHTTLSESAGRLARRTPVASVAALHRPTLEAPRWPLLLSIPARRSHGHPGFFLLSMEAPGEAPEPGVSDSQVLRPCMIRIDTGWLRLRFQDPGS